MNTLPTNNLRRAAAAVAAGIIVSFGALALERGHQGAVPAGIVEIGELTAVEVGSLLVATLPEVVVSANRRALASGADSRHPI